MLVNLGNNNLDLSLWDVYCGQIDGFVWDPDGDVAVQCNCDIL
jgi:hypothetical protein